MAEKKKTEMKKWLIPTICGVLIGVVITVIVVVVVNVVKPNIVGKYTFSATIDAEGKETIETAELMKSLGLSYTIEFKNDNTGVLKTELEARNDENESSEGDGQNTEDADTSEEGEVAEEDGGDDDDTVTNFTYSNGKIKAEDNTGVFEADYEFKDGAIILNIAGEIMKFTRI